MKRNKEVMMRSYRSYQEKRSRAADKTIIGIDPGKDREDITLQIWDKAASQAAGTGKAHDRNTFP